MVRNLLRAGRGKAPSARPDQLAWRAAPAGFGAQLLAAARVRSLQQAAQRAMGLARAGRCRRTPLHLREEARPHTGLLFSWRVMQGQICRRYKTGRGHPAEIEKMPP